MGRDNKDPAATNTTTTARTNEYFLAEETPLATTKTQTLRTSISTTTDPPVPVPHRPGSPGSGSGSLPSSSSSTIDLHKGTSRHIDHHPQKQMSTAKYAQDIERDIREPLVSKHSDPSRAAKENAIKQKLRTYEAVLAISEGYMLTTEQLAQWARYALRSSGVLDSRDRRLSTHGRGFIRDVRAWVEAVVELGLSKNSDDKIQEFIYNTSNAQVSARAPSMTGAITGGGATTSAIRPSNTEMQKMYKRLRNLASLLYTSPEFRKLLNDAAVLAREILADAASQVGTFASNTADKLRPSESETSKIDEPAEAGLGDKSSQLPSDTQIKSRAKEKARDYSEQARKKSQQTRDDMESYLRQKFPKQRRDAVVNRLKRVLSEIQNNPDFQESVDFMMGLMKKYGLTLKDKVAQEAQRTKETSGVQTDEHFDAALSQAKAILMVFADGKPLDDISDAFYQVMEDVQNDPELIDFYNDATSFTQRALTDKDFVTSDAADAEAHRLYDRSQELLDEKKDRYRPDMERLFEEVRSFRDCITNDRENRRVVETSKKVFNDLVVFDKKGEFKGFRKRVVRDLIDVVLPRFVGEIRYIPMPRIEYQDRDFDLILENVILESDHFVPYRMLFEAFSKAEFINDYTFTSKYSATTRINIENINLFFKDASFIFRKKTGLTFSDRGFFDIFMDGRGASAELILDSVIDDDDSDNDTPTAESYFHVRSVNVTIHKFRYNYNAYHSWAATLLAPVIRPTVRKLLARLLEQKIREMFEMADREMHATAERMRVASIASQGGGSVESWIRAVLSRPDLGRRHGGGYRVNVGTDEVLFPGEHAPGSIATKVKAVRERVDLGGEGEGVTETGWRNDIFDIRA